MIGLTEFVWDVQDRSDPSREKEVGWYIRSPSFYFGVKDHLHSEWQLVLYPDGCGDDCVGYSSLSLILIRCNVTALDVTYKVQISNDMAIVSTKSRRCEFGLVSRNPGGWRKLVESSILNPILCDNKLKIRCQLEIQYACGTPFEGFEPSSVSRIEGFRSLFQTSQFSDLRIVVGDRKFDVHKVLLVAQSPVFSAMVGNTDVINITDFSQEAVERFLEYFYFGVCDGSAELLALSEKYGVKALKLECERNLVCGLKVENAAQLLQLADDSKANFLKDEILKFIHTNLKEVQVTEGWKILPTSLLTDIINQIAGNSSSTNGIL